MPGRNSDRSLGRHFDRFLNRARTKSPQRIIHSIQGAIFYGEDSQSVSIINCEVFSLIVFNAMMKTKQLEPIALRDVVIVNVSECVCLFKCGVSKIRISQGCVRASRERPRLHRKRAGVSRS